MKHTPERSSSGAQTSEGSESLKLEQLADDMGRVFVRIEDIQDGTNLNMDECVAELIQDAEPEVVEGAMKTVDYEARAKALATRARNIREIFDQSVRRALLPVATALAMNTTPAMATEAQADRPTVVGLESTQVAKKEGEARELKIEDVFDLDSPLAISNEKLKNRKHDMSPEEISLMQELQQKTWREKNEWATVSWIDVAGNFKVEWFEGDPNSASMSFQIPFLKKYRKDEVFAHTHPLEPFITTPGLQPPSWADIGSCSRSTWEHKLTHRVVDPRGVWEYRCDKQNPYFVVKNESLESIETVGLARGLEQDDMAKLRQILSDIDGKFFNDSAIGHLGICLRELDGKYPGLYDSASEYYQDLSRAMENYSKRLLEYTHLSMWLIRNSADTSDETLAMKVKKYIDYSELMGVYMSYTPFKVLPEDKNLKK